jgi:hypothetical protein
MQKYDGGTGTEGRNPSEAMMRAARGGEVSKDGMRRTETRDGR